MTDGSPRRSWPEEERKSFLCECAERLRHFPVVCPTWPVIELDPLSKAVIQYQPIASDSLKEMSSQDSEVGGVCFVQVQGEDGADSAYAWRVEEI